jgi:hypothetical protein
MRAAGEELWKKTDKINAELFTLTYGAVVMQLIKDYEDYEDVNKQLERMQVPPAGLLFSDGTRRGYNIGTRLIEDFLARTSLPRCTDFRDVGEVLARVGFSSPKEVPIRNPPPGRLQSVPQHHPANSTPAREPARPEGVRAHLRREPAGGVCRVARQCARGRQGPGRALVLERPVRRHSRRLGDGPGFLVPAASLKPISSTDPISGHGILGLRHAPRRRTHRDACAANTGHGGRVRSSLFSKLHAHAPHRVPAGDD